MKYGTLYLLLFVSILFSACGKTDSVSLNIHKQDSTKQLLTFAFQGIESKTTSLISGDSIFLSVPGNVDLSSITPLIKIKGAYIQPASGVAQDFRGVQTYIITASDSTKKKMYVSVKRRDIVFIGGLVQFLALDSKDGSLIWKIESDENFAYSNPCLHGDTLYAGSISGYMYAFNARTGNLIWKTFLSTIGIESPATVDGNTLYTGDNNDYFVALNATTGAVKWKFETGCNVSSKPLVFRNTVIFGSSDGYVRALDTTQGNVVWRYSTAGTIVASSPVLSNGVVFIGSRSNQICAIDVVTGIEKWKYYTGISMEQSIPGVSNGMVYAAGWYDIQNFNIAGSLYALDEQTGDLKWHALDSLGLGGALTIANGLIYLPADDGNFYAVNAVTGETMWSVTINPNGSGGTVKNGVLYVGGGGMHNIYALDALTGKTKWTYPIPNDLITSDPAVGRLRKKNAPAVFL